MLLAGGRSWVAGRLAGAFRAVGHPEFANNNVLYLVKQGLLEIPVLYLSRHIVRTKPDCYRLLQEVRERDAWEERVLYMRTAVERTARRSDEGRKRRRTRPLSNGTGKSTGRSQPAPGCAVPSLPDVRISGAARGG